MKAVLSAILATACAAAFAQPDLRGFGRVEVESFSHKERKERKDVVSVMRFTCETAENAETVAGKFLMDLYDEPGVSFKDGIHETKGGAAFAVARDGKTTTIYAAENRSVLASHSSLPSRSSLVATASVPEYMKTFRWGSYGMGGLENFHSWQTIAKKNVGIDPKADKSPLDPREDYAFLREMGDMHFDNWLQLQAMDNSDGIVSPLVYSRKKLAEDFGVPHGFRVYMPNGDCGSYNWFGRRFASHMEQPSKWMQNGWLRYRVHQPHVSWYDKDVWGYAAAKTKDVMERFGTDKTRNWMHPAGELVHQPWYDWHSDYSETARKSWHDYLAKRMTLAEAASAYNHPERPFASWNDVPVPEFATFAGLDGMVLDLEGTWQTSAADCEEWRDIPDFPGSWDFLSLYAGPGERPPNWIGDGRRPEHKDIRRRFRRTFGWHKSPAEGKLYLYFFPMSGATLRHEVSLNGGRAHVVGNWCAIDVTDELRDGENTLDILLQGGVWNGRVFLSTEKPEMYPNMGMARCRLWTLWHEWRRDEKAERCEEVFDAMRQADPNAPIEFMAPLRFGQRVTNRLMRDWGAFAHFTGEGVWFFPWYKRYGKLYGYQGTSELGGPYDSVEKARTSSLRVFLAGIDMHKPVFLTQTYSRNPDVRKWWLEHKDLFARMGTYDIDLGQPQVLIYRRTELTEDGFPAPFPAVDTTVREIRSPWNYDCGRGSLQAIGQSFLYIDDDGLEDGKMDPFRVMIDSGNEIVPEDEVARIKKWVERGGVFIAYPFTGRSTPLKAEAWPMASLTGTRVTGSGLVRGKGQDVVFPEDGALPSFAGKTLWGVAKRLWGDDVALEPVADGIEVLARYADGRPAITARRMGRGMAVHVGTFFWRGSEDVKGIWNPKDGIERTFLRELLAFCGQRPALVTADTRRVQVQPYRSHDGLNLVAVLCNFNEEDDGEVLATKNAKDAKKETVVKLRTGSKPRRIVAFSGEGVAEKEFEFADGVATVRVALPPQEVAILSAECYSAADALAYWWKNSAEQWHEIKKPTRDFSKYTQGEWKDPTQDLKEGWDIVSGSPFPIPRSPFPIPRSPIPLDCLQFWGWPEGKGAVCRKVFDLNDTEWLKDGSTVRLVCGAWVGPNFLTPATIRLNGETLAANSRVNYLDFDVTAKLKAKGNVLEVEVDDAPAGQKFAGMNGSIYLYRRAKPAMSIDLLSPTQNSNSNSTSAGGKDAFSLYVPADWKGKYRVRLYMEGSRDVPKGVRVKDRFMRKHHHNFGNITDIDITDLLEFGAENRVDIGANSPSEQPDKTSIKTLTILRIDLY